MAGGYEQVGSASDVSNVNPMTGQMASQAQGQQAQLWAMLSGMTPEALMQGLQGQVGNIQGMTSALTGPYAANLMRGAESESYLGAKRTMDALSMEGYGAVGSGPGRGATEIAATLPYLQAQSQLAQQGLGLSSQFANAYTGASGQRAATLGSMWGSNQQGLFGLAAPNWYEPTYAYQPGFWDYASPVLGAAAGAGVGALTGRLFGGGGAAAASGGFNPYGNLAPSSAWGEGY